jgi:hypothetical protein
MISACLSLAKIKKIRGEYPYDDSMNAIASWGPSGDEITVTQLQSLAHVSLETRREAESKGVITKHRLLGTIILFLEKDISTLSRYGAEKKAIGRAEARAYYRERTKKNVEKFGTTRSEAERKKEENKRRAERIKIARAIDIPKTPEEAKLKDQYERLKAARRKYNKITRERMRAEGKKVKSYSKKKAPEEYVRKPPEGYAKAGDVAKIVGKSHTTVSRYALRHPELWTTHNGYKIIRIADIPKMMEEPR